MKRLLICAGILAGSAVLFAQQHKAPASPPETATGTIGGASITIKYSSPRVRGREGHIFNKGGLIQSTHKEYPVWRAGANAATTLTTDKNVKIGDINVPAGTYTLFVDIANPDAWELILNKKTGEWGLSYDATQDLGKTKMHMSKPSSMVEDLTYTIANGKITLAWENKEASVPVHAEK